MRSAAARQQLRVAIVSDSEPHSVALKSFLESNGMDVVLTQLLRRGHIDNIPPDTVDILVIDLDDNVDHELDFLDNLLGSTLPVLFNYGTGARSYMTKVDGVWARNLVSKLTALANVTSGAVDSELEQVIDNDSDTTQRTGHVGTPEAVGLQVGISDDGKANARTDPAGVVPPAPSVTVANYVWVLGASIGGPQAVKRFIQAVPPDLPVAFLLAQHIGEGFVELLGRQLDRATAFRVMPAVEGHLLQHQEILITPVDKRVLIDERGEVVLQPAAPDSLYTPSIDAVLVDTAVRYGEHAGAVIFSGMGSDGTEGSRVIAAHGGVVWAQEPESCVISSMPDSVRRAGVASFSGTPEELCERLVASFAR